MRASWLACSACLVPLVVAACSNMSGSIGPPAFDNRETDATPIVTGVAPSADGSAPLKPCARKPAPEVRPAVVLVNASASLGAVRLCPAADDGSSGSFEPPIPTSIMPRSNLAGVDVASAVRIAPTNVLAGSHVLVLKIGQNAKDNPTIATASCRQLACGSAPAGDCFAAADVLRVPVLGMADAGAASGFAKAGTIAVLRDDGAAGPRIELEEGRPIEPGCVNHVDFDFRDFTGRDARASYDLDEAAPQFADVPATSYPLPADYRFASLSAGGHRETLEEIHQHSEPRVPIDAFYRTKSPFLLFLVGPPAGQHFVAMPVNGVGDEVVDGGRD